MLQINMTARFVNSGSTGFKKAGNCGSHASPATGGGNYFEELLARIRDIRSSEKVFWRKAEKDFEAAVKQLKPLSPGSRKKKTSER